MRYSDVLAAPIQSEPITDWERFEDSFFGFSLEYPAGWEMQVSIDQTDIIAFPEAIIKRYTFVGQGGKFYLDAWLSREKGFTQWLEWYDAARDPVPLTEPNATVGGYPAVVFVNEGGTLDLLMAYWSDSRYVFRLLYTITRSEAGLQAYRHMLDTMRQLGNRATTLEVPEKVWEDAQEAIGVSGLTGQLISECCNKTAPCDQFSCCTQGNCTWWVCYKYSGLPFYGDAKTWWSQVPNLYDQGWRRSSGPQTGTNIAWQNGGPGEWGHVAYLPWYYGGTDIVVSEMFCDGVQVCERDNPYEIYDFDGYIWTIYTK